MRPALEYKEFADISSAREIRLRISAEGLRIPRSIWLR
jgi:ribosomal protein L28